uniref:BRCA2 DNA repair associated n=1 Tax=Sparus aurata TaxID=8175 RepID=A0A671W034_SPAAU
MCFLNVVNSNCEFEQLGPLDPDWFERLTAQTLSSEGNVFDQDELCANQEGNFKAPFDKSAAESQLFSTPKVFRHSRVGSPETEDENSFTAGHETLPWTATQSPCLFGMSKEGHAKHISESLGAQIHPDISWTSSLNTPPAIPSTLILTVSPKRVVSPVAGQNPESLVSPQSSLNQIEGVWRPKLPDAIEEGEIRSTVASVLDGAEDVLSIFFTNSSSTLRKVKTDRIKRKQIIPTKEHGSSSADISAINNAASSEQKTSDQDSGRHLSPPPVKTGDVGNTQWSPLSFSDIPPCTADSSCPDNGPAIHVENSISTEQLQRDFDSGQQRRPHMKITDSGFTKKKRKFVYTIKTSKLQVQGIEKQSQKMDSSPGIPDSAKLQDLDISQLSRDFAQDFSQMPEPVTLTNQKAGQANLAHDYGDVSNRRSVATTNQNYSINEGTIGDSGFQSAVADTIHVTASSFAVPNSENNGHSQQWTGCKTHIQRSTFTSTSKGSRKTQLDDDLQEAGTDADMPKSELHMESTSNRLSSSAKGTVDNTNCIPLYGQLHGSLPKKTTVSLSTVNASGFKTASNKGIEISSANLERAKHLFEETEGERILSDQHIRCPHDTIHELGINHGSVKDATFNSNQPPSSNEKSVDSSCQLTASQKADVTELCTLLEEADSQFEFTQFKTGELKQDNVTSHQKVDKELDPDFLTGIDFDDSFNSDLEKHLRVHDKMTKVSDGETSTATSKSTGLSLSNEMKKENSSAEDASSSSNKLEKNNYLMLGVGFKTAGGNVLRVSKKCLSKAKANAFFKDCDVMDTSAGVSVQHRKGTEPLSGVGVSVNVEQHKVEIHNFGLKSTNVGSSVVNELSASVGFSTARGEKVLVSADALKKAECLLNDIDTLQDTNTQRKQKDGALETGHRVNQIQGSPPKNGGFQTASGKGFTISSTALKRAKIMLSECGEVDDKIGVKPSHSGMPVPGPTPRNCGFLAASGKPVAFSSEALEKAKALFGDINSSAETPAVSHTRNSEKRQDKDKHMEKIHSGFSNAGGTKVHISLDSTNAAALHGNPPLISMHPPLCQTSKNSSCAANSELSNIGGFCTASGKKVSISDDAMTKAKSLFNENTTIEDTNKPLKQKVDSLPQQNGGFQTASGKGVVVSSAALKKAKTLLSVCEGVEDNISVQPTCSKMTVPGPSGGSHGFVAASGKPVAFSSEALEKAKALFGDISSSAETTAMQEADALFMDGDIMDSRDGITASGKNASVSHDALTKAKSQFNENATFEETNKWLTPELKTVPSQNGGFQTASGKGVAISSAALKKAKTLFSECEGVQDKIDVKPTCSKMPVPGPTPRNHGFLAASGKPVAISTEAFEKAKALFDDISSSAEIPTVSRTRNSEQKDALNDKEKTHCGFSTAGGAKVSVSQKNLLKAKNLLNDLADEECHDLSPHGSHKSIVNDVRRTSSFPTASDKDIPTKDSAPEEVTFLSSLQQFDPEIETFQKSSALGNILIKAKAPTDASKVKEGNLHDSPQAEMAIMLDREINQTSSSEGKQTEESSVLYCHSLNLTGCTETQRRFLAQEALDCTKALLEDENLSEQKLSMTSVNVPLQDNPKSFDGSVEEQKGKGKRLVEDPDMTGQPPLKRRLLEEFDRTVDGPRGSTLEPQKSSPIGVMKDRRVFKYSDMFQNLHNVELARDMQDMRLRKKKRQTIRPLPGSLFLTKTSGVPRIRLKAAVNRKPPARYTQKQLYSRGLHQHVCEITSDTAECFRFSLKQFVKQEAFIDGGGVQLADGGWLIPSNDGTAGKEEFYSALCDTPGVDPKLISEEWVYNHYRWIVWKQAAMERSFPETMGSLCLTPEQVLLQLKYRYDVEVDHSRRPALRKIMEKDDTAAKTLVLCVCGVVSGGNSTKRQSGVETPSGDAKVENQSGVVWLTDGWYGIKTQLDEPLTAMLQKGRLAVGGKLIISGAQLVGSQDACSPLEAPDSLMLKICANSSRPARWDAKLGFHRDPRPFLLPVSSLYSNGGPVGCVDIVILRSYPIQWMERKPDGGVVFRSVRAEEKEARRYNSHKQKAMESLFAKVQAEFEKEENGNKQPQRRRRTMSRQDIAGLQDGEELYEAVGHDPSYLETLHSYRRSLMEKKQAELQDRYRRALESAEDREGSCPKRDVTPVWRLCIADTTDQHVYQLNLWRPPSDLQSLLKEGCRYKVYNLTASEGKKPVGSTSVQLTGTKKTQFQDLQASQEWLLTHFQPRFSTRFVDLQNTDFQPLCGEVDLTGYVISIIDGQGFSPAFYLADGNLNFIKVRCFGSLAQAGLEDVVKPRVLLALSNLQLRGQSTSPTPVVFAGDLTVFSTNPKEVHLQESLSQLRNLIQANFSQTAEETLSHLIKCDGLSSVSSPALQTRTPASAPTTDRRQDTKMSPVRSFGSFTPLSRNSPAQNCSTEKDPSSLKRRRALDYLSRIPSPPPLSNLGSVASPCVNKTFVPPRRSGTPSTLKTVQTPARKAVSSPVEEEWVNDEELAMIDTQALLVGDLK